MKTFVVHFEIFYPIDGSNIKGFDTDIQNIKHTAKKITRFFNYNHVTNDNDIVCYEKENDIMTKRMVNSCAELLIDEAEYRKAFRKYFDTRLFSNSYFLDSFMDSTNTHKITFTLDKFRGPIPILLAYTTIESPDNYESPSQDLIDECLNVLKESFPSSVNGKISVLTPLKISTSRTTYKIPFTKLMPYIANKRYCEKITDLMDKSLVGEHLTRWNNTKLLFEYKWIRIPTGVILVHERYGQLINPITGNKIDEIYVKQMWPAFTTDDLMNILRVPDYGVWKNSVAIKTVSAGYRCHPSLSVADNYAKLIIEFLHCSPYKIHPITIERKFSNYYSKRIKYISDYERLRETKRALSNLNK